MLTQGSKVYVKHSNKYYQVRSLDFNHGKIVLENRYKYSFKEFGLDIFYTYEDSLLSLKSIQKLERYLAVNRNLTSLNPNYRYDNHCYKCKNRIDSYKHKKCDVCGWHICPNCGNCGCNYRGW